MMVRRFGVRDEPRHERDRLGKTGERKRLPDSASLAHPAGQRRQGGLDLIVGAGEA